MMEAFIGKFSNFSNSVVGQMVYAAAGLLLIMAVAGYFFRKRVSLKIITEAASCMALALILSVFAVYKMPQGGTLTLCSMFFITYVGYLFGPAVGITAGVAYGFLHLAINPYVVHPVQLIMDYPLAYGALGFAGFFRKQKMQMGYVAGVSMRMLCHVLSGVIFFSEYAGATDVWIYSIGYNGTYIIPEAIVTCVIISVPAVERALVKMRSATA